MRLIAVTISLLLTTSLFSQSLPVERWHQSGISIDSIWKEVEYWPRPELNNWKADTITIVSVTSTRGLNKSEIKKTLRKYINFDYVLIRKIR